MRLLYNNNTLAFDDFLVVDKQDPTITHNFPGVN